MNNYDMALDATDTALNSQGSSMKEQEKYANSLEGRVLPSYVEIHWIITG
ncbi:hypothetical protein ABEY43_06415 [Priestia megaterium]